MEEERCMWVGIYLGPWGVVKRVGGARCLFSQVGKVVCIGSMTMIAVKGTR